MGTKFLEFEKPIADLYAKIQQLKLLSSEEGLNLDEEIKRIEVRAEALKKDIYSNLSPSQIVQLARHQNRPDSLSLIRLISDSFLECHGDRLYRDDPSIVGGIAKIEDKFVMILGHQKGHDTKENIYRNFGMPHPEGYRKALRLMQLADKFSMPIVTFIDTPGAYPGIEAEERGQAEAIARNLREMTGLSVPVITYVIGEGGSGGALAIGVSNKVFMFQYDIYSVISPEGCASILFRDAAKSDIAAKNLKLVASDVLSLKVADGVIPEPIGGAHTNWEWVAQHLKAHVLDSIATYDRVSPDQIKEERYQKFRSLGVFTG